VPRLRARRNLESLAVFALAIVVTLVQRRCVGDAIWVS
jgi:hypothetical protein